MVHGVRVPAGLAEAAVAAVVAVKEAAAVVVAVATVTRFGAQLTAS